MSLPWVITCTGCGCIVTCFAIDPQVEHMNPAWKPPSDSAHVTCSCCWKTYRYYRDAIVRGIPKQNETCARRRQPARLDGALLVAASIIATIRLRGQEIKPSPKLTMTVKDSVALARTVLAQLESS